MSGSALYIITPSLLFKKHETDFHGKRRLKIKKRLDKYSKDCVGRKGSHVGGGMIFFFFFSTVPSSVMWEVNVKYTLKVFSQHLKGFILVVLP